MFSNWLSMQSLLTIILFVLSFATALHALTHKRDPRSALLWIVICLSLPLAGAILYLLFGINRADTKVQKLGATPEALQCSLSESSPDSIASSERSPHQQLATALTGLRITTNNSVEALKNGEQAYPAMLDAIDKARKWIYLCSYIFESKLIGEAFILALTEAKNRGVAVHVLLDGAGAWYDRDRTRKILQKQGINTISFLPPLMVLPKLTINLRNHRKILLVDGEKGFTGGMNIRQTHLLDAVSLDRATKDFMFCLQGPVLKQIGKVFEEDWFYVSGEKLSEKVYQTNVEGGSQCRVISDGPGVHLDSLIKVLISAVNHAESSISIVTPYFLPPRELIVALQSASIRGVKVSLILPENNNLPYVHWAMRHSLRHLLGFGIRVFYQQGAFDHSKLFLVDDKYSQIGSANFDARSLRLNFEMNVEIFDADFGKKLGEHIKVVQLASVELNSFELENRSFLIKLRDAFCWLFTPYL